MAEESGGAAMGGDTPFPSRNGRRRMLAIKEKDAFQIGVLTMALAARLHMRGSTFAAWYLDALDRHAIVHRHYDRQDVTLFDESLRGPARSSAMDAGNRRKTAVVAFFRDLAEAVQAGRLDLAGARAAIQGRVTTGWALPPMTDLFWAGDGTFLQFDGIWAQLRASGTDAVLRYYAEGADPSTVASLQEALSHLRLDD